MLPVTQCDASDVTQHCISYVMLRSERYIKEFNAFV
jgi:hypothetical protein